MRDFNMNKTTCQYDQSTIGSLLQIIDIQRLVFN